MALADLTARIDGAGTKRVGDATHLESVDGHDIVRRDPVGLASSAGLPLETYALARMVRSENGSQGALTLLATAESARNEARRRKVSIAALLLFDPGASRKGFFGRQTSGRWAATSLDPDGRAVEAAKIAIEGSDATGGATDFFDPSSQDLKLQAGKKLRLTSAEYIERNARDGLTWPGPLEGIDPYHLMLFRPTTRRPVDPGPALSALTRGRTTRGIAWVGGLALVVIVLAFLASGGAT